MGRLTRGNYGSSGTGEMVERSTDCYASSVELLSSQKHRKNIFKPIEYLIILRRVMQNLVTRLTNAFSKAWFILPWMDIPWKPVTEPCSLCSGYTNGSKSVGVMIHHFNPTDARPQTVPDGRGGLRRPECSWKHWGWHIWWKDGYMVFDRLVSLSTGRNSTTGEK